ncbi:hypothetical protein M0805_009673 [Coniferiporia weirii]|nr:hypothetical protein M0805_009673 [Coniferiporia weirii]
MSSNNRASLLAGLRTGGVRSTTNPFPHTAGPNATSFPRQELPMSASVGGSFNQLYPAQAQAHVQAQQQAFQMQMMQMEIMRLKALQQVQQQYQIELVRQQQQHQQQQHQTANRRFSQYGEQPQTAGPAATSFMSRHPSQADYIKPQFSTGPRAGMEDQVPMTASLGGKFGGRLNPNATSFSMGGFPEEEEMTQATVPGSQAPVNTPATAAHTTVISGGTPLGVANWNGAVTNSAVANPGVTPSKSDTSLNWRRGASNSVLNNGNGNRSASVNVRITPPPSERVSPPPGIKTHRPEPLRFSVVINEPAAPLVIVDSSDGETYEDGDDSSSSSAKSEPTTPPSGGSSASSGMPPLSPREAASKRLYEGLGIGRPVPQTAAVHTINFPMSTGAAPSMPHTSAGAAFPNRMAMASQPTRQPRGPPSGLDELGPKNFATRIRRKAIGGLGAMLDARVNRREVEAF